MHRIITIITLTLALSTFGCSGVKRVAHLEIPNPPPDSGYDLYSWTDTGLFEPSVKWLFAIDSNGRLISGGSGGSAGLVPQILTIGAIGAVAGAISTLDFPSTVTLQQP